MRRHLAVFAALTTASGPGAEAVRSVRLDLTTMEGTGIEALTAFAGHPDRWGIVRKTEILLPRYERGVYYHSPRRWGQAGLLKPVRINGGVPRYDRADLDALVDQAKKGARGRCRRRERDS